MHRRSALALLLVLTSLPAFAAERATAPDWTLTTPDGRKVHYAEQWANGPSIVLFWATWCPYCKALTPHLQSMVEEYRSPQPLRVFAISIMEDGDPAGVIAAQGYDFLPLLDGDAVAETYGVRGTPGLFVVDKEGRVVLDLRTVMNAMAEDPDVAKLSNAQKAARRAPYWAARIREALDTVYR